jgi:hypothetical protein
MNIKNRVVYRVRYYPRRGGGFGILIPADERVTTVHASLLFLNRI